MNIRTATQKDTNALKQLWLDTFCDTKEFVDWNFKYNYNPQNVVLAEEGANLAAALHIVEYKVCLYGKNLKGAYISAVATKKEYRGRGCASEILNFASTLCAQRGFDLCFLVPAINGFYEKLGYFSVCEKTESVFSADKSDRACKPLEDLTADKFFEIYKASVKDCDFYLERSKKNCDMILNDHLKNTKGTAKAFLNEGYILLGEDGGKTKIFELCAKTAAAKEVLWAYAKSFKCGVVWQTAPLMVKTLSDKATLKKLKAETQNRLLPPKSVFFNLVL